MTDERQWLRPIPSVPDRHGDELHYHQPDGSVNVVVASECDLYGHDYEVRDLETEAVKHVVRNRRPDSVFCGRCGKSWKVEHG